MIFRTAFEFRKIGRFQYEPKERCKVVLVRVELGTMVQNRTLTKVLHSTCKGWEYLIKFSEGRQWGNEYVNQEFWLRYIGEWLMAKIGWTELGLEDISYGQGDIRIHWTPEVLKDKLHLSIGLKHRQHPVYGFDAMVLDTTWYKGQWWNFC